MERHQNRGEAGFTLIELLVVIAIVGILASIALAQYSTYKQQAVDGLMESTLQAGRHAMEAYFVEHDTYQTANTTLLHDNFGFRQAAMATFVIQDQQPLTFVIRVCAAGGTSPGLEFNSTVGRSQPVASCS